MKTSTVITLGCVGAALGGSALTVGFCALAFHQAGKRAELNRPRTTPPTIVTKEESARVNRRLFTEEHSYDDNARGHIFRSVLKKAGERCDSVEKALMTTPGQWKVTCAPGHLFMFDFDSNGELEKAVKVW